MNSEDEIAFEDDEISPGVNSSPPWKIAIIDDEEQIHQVTQMALGNYEYADRPLTFLSAYSAEEGRQLFKEHRDIAVCLLDVVMETETAGLDLVKDIRANGNDFTRIVLRTGQPGQAPEEEVIQKYDINDYKEKTELTRTKLTTLMHSCLKTYEFILKQEKTKLGFEKVLESMGKIFENTFIKDFAEGIMMQMSSLFDFGEDAALVKIDHMLTAYEKENNIEVIAGIGDFNPVTNPKLDAVIPKELINQVITDNHKFKTYYDENYFISSYLSKDLGHYLLALSGNLSGITELHKKMASIFCHNAMSAFENIILNNELEEAQSEMVQLLGGAVETRSKETGNHIKRVSELSELLALKFGMDIKRSELIKISSPLHDIGKIAIPDSILNKQGKLDSEEWKIMQTHADIGFNMLSDSSNDLIKTASLIAYDHHEHWNGNGYPNNKKGDDISIEGRITAVADVFDALCSKRCYKDAWTYEQAFEYMNQQSGKQFDPAIIEIMNSNKDSILKIYEKYKD